MKRLTIAVLAVCLGIGAATGCSSGNEAGCRKAIKNIFKITGMDKGSSGPNVDAAVRSCRANASGDAIDCMIAAKTLDDLSKCEGGVADDLLKDETVPEEKQGE